MSTHYSGTPQEKRVLDTWIKLSRAKETIGHQLRRLLDGRGVTITQFGVLEILHHIGPLPLKAIGNKILLSSSNLVTVIDNLEKRGLVIRQANEKDRRSSTIHLTPGGVSTIEPIFEDHLADLSKCFSVLNETELRTLGELSKKLGTQQNNTKRKQK